MAGFQKTGVLVYLGWLGTFEQRTCLWLIIIDEHFSVFFFFSLMRQFGIHESVLPGKWLRGSFQRWK